MALFPSLINAHGVIGASFVCYSEKRVPHFDLREKGPNKFFVISVLQKFEEGGIGKGAFCTKLSEIHFQFCDNFAHPSPKDPAVLKILRRSN